MTGLEFGRISRECSATSLRMPGISEGLHTKISALALVDEHHFLFAVEGSADLQRLAIGSLRVKGDIVGTLGRLEAACVPLLGVHGLLGHSLQLRGMGFVER